MGTLFQLNLAPALQAPIKTSSTILFNWGAVTGLTYQLQFKTNLAQSVWANLGSSLVATNGAMQISVPLGADPRRFYRMTLLP